MKKLLVIMIIVAGGVGINSCSDYLETDIQRFFDEEMFLRSGFNNMLAFGMGTYDYLHHFNGYGGSAMLAAACDEADYSRPGDIQRFNTGAWGPFSNPDDVYAHYYRGIRHANLFLEKTVDFRELIVQDTIRNMPAYLDNVDNIEKLRAEVRFLRAFFYMELVKRYGGVSLVTKVLTQEEAFGLTRDSFDACIEFIVSECDSVYPHLTNHYFNYGRSGTSPVGRGDGGSDNSRLGRIEKPAAKALKLRALLYAASPLHNPSNDLARWARAAEAGQEIFDDPQCAHIRFLNGSYRDLFHSQFTNLTLTPRRDAMSGIIMTRPFQRNGDSFERANYPVGMINGGGGVTSPSQNLVDAYEMRATGLPITDPQSGYNSDHPFEGRDPRLLLTVVVNGSQMGLNTDNSPRVVQSFQGGSDGIGARFGATTTGYYLRKMVIENFNLAVGGSRSKSWVFMRYAEVLLNFAEAMNEAFGPDAKPAIVGGSFSKSAREAVNEVRGRSSVNMPSIPLGLSQEQMRERIRNERRVELAFEEHRFFDVRRWKIAENTENQDIMGVRVIEQNGNLHYERFVVEERTFNPEMYLYPIPYQEISKSNGQITQNPGW